MKGLLVDYGGVLTSNVFESFRAFCRAEGLDPNAFFDLMRTSEEARSDLRAVETGRLSEYEFGRRVGERLGLEIGDRLVDGLFGGLRADGAMVAAVRRARAAGVRTGLLSNSMGEGRYERASFPELFDAVVISGEVGMRKPDPEIYALAAERLGLRPEACVFVDDLPGTLKPARAIGMATVAHRGDAAATLAEVELHLGVSLR